MPPNWSTGEERFSKYFDNSIDLGEWNSDIYNSGLTQNGKEGPWSKRNKQRFLIQ